MDGQEIVDEIKPLMYCIEHQPEFPLRERLQVIDVLLEASKKLQPLYIKMTAKEELGSSFLFRWNPEEDV